MKFTVKELKDAGVWDKLRSIRKKDRDPMEEFTDETEVQLRENDGLKVVFDPDFLEHEQRKERRIKTDG